MDLGLFEKFKFLRKIQDKNFSHEYWFDTKSDSYPLIKEILFCSQEIIMLNKSKPVSHFDKLLMKLFMIYKR